MGSERVGAVILRVEPKTGRAKSDYFKLGSLLSMPYDVDQVAMSEGRLSQKT
jgi:hypothetical protein